MYKTLSSEVQTVQQSKKSDMGYYLISHGRYEFEKEIKFKVKAGRILMRTYVALRTPVYLGSILILTFLFVGLCLDKTYNLNTITYLLAALAFFPASELALTLVNRFTVNLLVPRHLPRLDFSKSSFYRIPAFSIKKNTKLIPATMTPAIQ